MSSKYYQKTPVSSNLILSNKSVHRSEEHIIFKLMTYRSPNSIALTAIDNDLLILKQWKGALHGHQKLSFSRMPRSWGIILYAKRNGTSWGCTWGNGVKFSILLLYEAVSATVSLIPGQGRESEEGGGGSRLYRPNFNMWKFELLYLRNLYLVIQNMNFTLPV